MIVISFCANWIKTAFSGYALFRKRRTERERHREKETEIETEREKDRQTDRERKRNLTLKPIKFPPVVFHHYN